MLIRKLDRVILPDGSLALALEKYETATSRVYKVRRLDNSMLEYVDGARIVLKRRHFNNLMSDIFSFITTQRIGN